MPPLVLSIIGFVQLAVKAAPQVEQVYNDAKNLIRGLFAGGLITAAQQQALMDWANAHQSAVLAGVMPPEFVVTAAAPVTDQVAAAPAPSATPVPAVTDPNTLVEMKVNEQGFHVPA